jgi:hypothetical protein
MAELERIELRLAKVAAPGDLVALLANDALAGSRIERTWRCRELLSEAGFRQGNPRDAAQAIAALDARRAEGCRALLVWKPACEWWFEVYPEWVARLTQTFELVTDDARIAVYRPRAA